MTNIAFYLPNKGTKNVDCSDVFNGNPGIGGSEYAMLLLICSLKLNCEDLNTILYVDEESVLPPMLKIRQVKDWQDMAQKTTEDNISILVLGYNSSFNHKFHLLHEKLKIIIWAHNFIRSSDLSFYAKNKRIAKIVCVGYEQLDLYRDHVAFKKSTAIYNGVDVDSIKKQSGEMLPFNQRPLHVTYIGSFIPVKGFHVLAKVWPQVLKVYPDAVLNVIGSGKLYNRNASLGNYGIADAEYEKVFMPYLVDADGQILSSVKFWGILGSEKNNILQRTRVGVPNPWGRSETFGYTAIEMQACGALVTTINCPAYLETVSPSAGILYRNQKRLDKVLADSIILLLGKNENHYEKTIEFLESNFSITKITEEWHQLFIEMMAGRKNRIVPIRANKNYRLKRWKEINRKVRNFIPFGYTILPPLWFYVDDIIWKLKDLLKRDHVIRHLIRKYILR
jgi:glycosyltransferase involved in cell wall biosynthesis